jgi:uncharacterized membrane protein YccC
MAKRLTVEEKKQKLLDQLAQLERAEAAQKMADDPRMARIAEAISRLEQIQHRASVTIKGRGRGNGAAARIEALEAEIADLRFRLDRDTAVELVIEEAIQNAEAFRDGVLDGSIEPTERMPELPEVLRPSAYKLTPTESAKETEAKIRAEAQASRA